MSRRNLVKRVAVAAALVVPLSVGALLAASPAQASAEWTLSGKPVGSYSAAFGEAQPLAFECQQEGGVVEKAWISELQPGDGVYVPVVVCES